MGKKLARRYFKYAPPVGKCKLAPSRHSIFKTVFAIAQTNKIAMDKLMRSDNYYFTQAMERLEVRSAEKLRDVETYFTLLVKDFSERLNQANACIERLKAEKA